MLVEDQLCMNGSCFVRSLQRLMRKYLETGNVLHRHRNSRKRTLSEVDERFIDKVLTENDKLTSYKLKEMLVSRWLELNSISIPNIKRC